MEQLTQAKVNSDEVYFQVQKSFFSSGIAAELKRSGYTFLAIAAYMDKDGYAYPSQQTLAEDTGATRATINKHIKELTEYHVDGKPILRQNFFKTESGHWNSYYQITPISQIKKFTEGKVEKIKNPPRKPAKKKSAIELAIEKDKLENPI
ncbi:helix-turn-helix domain-containing protein [Priestia megaterium]|uniref:helix-turn-helix domain-containing protein n=1 Tax=Priestia megaterium TaxID=1404 RepID=UPI0025A32C87|nr:helix-turn-helix domain-containing protein [Priestia megaterium]MDM8149969.1 helix-turn-helix domain-containing protein [Priestia megaterium]